MMMRNEMILKLLDKNMHTLRTSRDFQNELFWLGYFKGILVRYGMLADLIRFLIIFQSLN